MSDFGDDVGQFFFDEARKNRPRMSGGQNSMLNILRKHMQERRAQAPDAPGGASGSLSEYGEAPTPPKAYLEQVEYIDFETPQQAQAFQQALHAHDISCHVMDNQCLVLRKDMDTLDAIADPSKTDVLLDLVEDAEQNLKTITTTQTTDLDTPPAPETITYRPQFEDLCAESIKSVRPADIDEVYDLYVSKVHEGYEPDVIMRSYLAHKERYLAKSDTPTYATPLKTYLETNEGLKFDARLVRAEIKAEQAKQQPKKEQVKQQKQPAKTEQWKAEKQKFIDVTREELATLEVGVPAYFVAYDHLQTAQFELLMETPIAGQPLRELISSDPKFQELSEKSGTLARDRAKAQVMNPYEEPKLHQELIEARQKVLDYTTEFRDHAINTPGEDASSIEHALEEKEFTADIFAEAPEYVEIAKDAAIHEAQTHVIDVARELPAINPLER